MLKRPNALNSEFALRGKFNSILEECLTDGKSDNHYIISIDVDDNNFTASSSLNDNGKDQFWKEVNKGIQKFDDNKISLRPRQWISSKKQEDIKNTPGKNSLKRKIPTPLPKSADKGLDRRAYPHHNPSARSRLISRSHSRSRSHSCSMHRNSSYHYKQPRRDDRNRKTSDDRRHPKHYR